MRRINIEEASMLSVLAKGVVLNMDVSTILDRLRQTQARDIAECILLKIETGISGSLTNPVKYFDANLKATFNVLEECKKNGVNYLIYASSSSVYSPNQSIMYEDSDTSKQLSPQLD